MFYWKVTLIGQVAPEIGFAFWSRT
jgi:hypothetical protein